jgi:hypothetical protein
MMPKSGYRLSEKIMPTMSDFPKTAGREEDRRKAHQATK